MKTTIPLLTLTLLLGACAQSPYQQQNTTAAFLRPPGIDVGNVNSTIAGTVNPANLGQGGIVSPGHGK